jgi:hypothetical protein
MRSGTISLDPHFFATLIFDERDGLDGVSPTVAANGAQHGTVDASAKDLAVETKCIFKGRG